MSPGFEESWVGVVDDGEPVGVLDESGVPATPGDVPPAEPGVPWVLVVPAVVLELSCDVVAEPLPAELDEVDASPAGAGVEVVLPVAAVLPVVEVDEGFDIDESVLG